MGRKTKEATTPYTTSIAQARIADLVKYGRVSRAQFTAAAQLGEAKMLEHFEPLPYRGAQLWHLVGQQPVAVAWIDGPQEGVEVFFDLPAGTDFFAQVCLDLGTRDPIEAPKKRRGKPHG
jgi:hypothetical protein